MPKSDQLHMSSDEFRKQGKALIDWIADYYENIEQYPVLSNVAPGDIRKALPASPPLEGEPFEHMMADVERVIMPGVTHWQSPNFYAFFPSNTSGPAILGELLSAGLGVQGMLWATSPACTELETHVLDWLVDMMDLPAAFKSTATGGGVIQDTASSAVLCALLAGREQATGYASNKSGGNGKLVVYTSADAHSSIEKAAKIAGIGADNVRLVPVDETRAMIPDALAKMIEEDKAAGLTPCFVCATVGTTSTNGIDPVAAIGAICNRAGIWFHVDAAMAGTAALCSEFRYINNGLELADSYCFNPHKWMLTNFDCTVFYVRQRKALIDTLSILPEYLRNQATASGEVIDYRDWHVQLGRRFRALKLWFVIRYYGVHGLQQYVRQHIAIAQAFANWVREDARFELVVTPPLNLVCFRMKADDTINENLLMALNKSGKVYLTHTKVSGQYTLRLCVGTRTTTLAHVASAWEQIQEVAAGLIAS
ncbi:MAG: aminotransferase class V-fold PLP-dependent enzyme [Bacteroidota bacterium]